MTTWEIIYDDDYDYNIHYQIDATYDEMLEEVENLKLHGCYHIDVAAISE